eukprot:14023307-Alexandrium_andersonii.AAC.1
MAGYGGGHGPDGIGARSLVCQPCGDGVPAPEGRMATVGRRWGGDGVPAPEGGTATVGRRRGLATSGAPRLGEC